MGLFRPDRLKMVQLTFHEKRKRRVLQALHEFGNVHIADPLQKGNPVLENPEERRTLNLLNQMTRIVEYVEAEELFFERLATSGKKLQFPDLERSTLQEFNDEVEKFLTPIQEKVFKLRNELTELEHEKDQLEQTLDISRRLLPLGEDFNFDLLGEGDYFYVVAGEIKSDRVNNVLLNIKKASNGNFFFKKGAPPDDEGKANTSVLVIGVEKQHAAALNRILSVEGFITFRVPEGMHGNVHEIVKSLEAKLSKIQKKIKDIKSQLREIAESVLMDLMAYHEQLQVESARIHALYKGESLGDNLYRLWVWVPAKKVKALEKYLRKNEESLILEEEDAHYSPDLIPSHVEHGTLNRPYLDLVTAYGTPGYYEFNPTILVHITFPLFFGLMFADFFDGLAVVAMGLYGKFSKPVPKDAVGLTNDLKRYLQRGWLMLLEMGGFAMLFGILFGSYRGITAHHLERLMHDYHVEIPEGIIKLIEPKWFSPESDSPLTPFNDTLAALELAIVIGIIHIAIALIIQFIVHWQHHKEEAIFLPGAFLVFYVGFFFLVFGYGFNPFTWVSNGPAQFKLRALRGAFGLSQEIISIPLGLPFLNIPLLLILISLGASFVFHFKHGGDAMAEYIDYVITMISNTVSYARLFAYGQVHAALSLAFIFIFETFMPSNMILVGTIMGALVGGLIVIPLETLSAFIQSLRLHWLEFFSKSGYQGTGKKFDEFSKRRVLQLLPI